MGIVGRHRGNGIAGRVGRVLHAKLGLLAGHVGNVKAQVSSEDKQKHIDNNLKGTVEQVHDPVLEDPASGVARSASNGLQNEKGSATERRRNGENQRCDKDEDNASLDLGAVGVLVVVVSAAAGRSNIRRNDTNVLSFGIALVVNLLRALAGEVEQVGGLNPGGRKGLGEGTVLVALAKAHVEVTRLEGVGSHDELQTSKSIDNLHDTSSLDDLLAHGQVLRRKEVEVGNRLANNTHDNDTNDNDVEDIHEHVEPPGVTGLGMAPRKDTVTEKHIHNVDENDRDQGKDSRGNTHLHIEDVTTPVDSQTETDDSENAVPGETKKRPELVATLVVLDKDISIGQEKDTENGDKDGRRSSVGIVGVVTKGGRQGSDNDLDNLGVGMLTKLLLKEGAGRQQTSTGDLAWGRDERKETTFGCHFLYDFYLDE